MAGFSMYKRIRKNGKPVFYAQFKNHDGSYNTAKSTGCSTKRDAIAWCEEYLQKNGIPLPGRKITLTAYSQNFFSWTGRWATNKKIEGRRISERHCRSYSDMLRMYIIPALGELTLNEMDKQKLTDFRNSLFSQKYSSSLINKCLYALHAILEAAEEAKLLATAPQIKPAANNARQKGILTLEEAHQLFSFPWVPKNAQRSSRHSRFMGYTGNLLAATTGIRLGELQAITLEDLHLNQNCIWIRTSWDNSFDKLNTTTKTGKERTVTIPISVTRAIRKLLASHPDPMNPHAFLFYGEKIQTKPAEPMVFVRALYEAMERIGIDDTERRKRNISFHSWRHFLNSFLLNGKIPLQKVQLITGHMTASMSQHYYHMDDMSDVLTLISSAFSYDETDDSEGILGLTAKFEDRAPTVNAS